MLTKAEPNESKPLYYEQPTVDFINDGHLVASERPASACVMQELSSNASTSDTKTAVPSSLDMPTDTPVQQALLPCAFRLPKYFIRMETFMIDHQVCGVLRVIMRKLNRRSLQLH